MNDKIGNVSIDYTHYSGVDQYTDGDIEDELLDIVKKYNEEEFNKIIAERKKWPILYHLSHIRTNIIEWLPISKSENILEIGSGCGAITGILSDKGKSVTCIELSNKRSLINAYRNSNKENIEILVGNFETIEKDLSYKYDYITLIGVFEYAESYISKKNPYETFLEKIKLLLNDGGKIIIAIENKLGLKYWAGCQEDHFGGYFTGLEGYEELQGVKTFSKTELEKIFKEVNLNYTFYYPYPDYKLPMVIYSDEYLPKEGELNNNINNFDRDRIISFDESKVYDTLIKEKVFPFYSNSFLIILEKGDR